MNFFLKEKNDDNKKEPRLYTKIIKKKKIYEKDKHKSDV